MIHQAVPSGRGLISNGFIFQHNSDPKHTANAVKAWIENHAVGHYQIWILLQNPNVEITGIILTEKWTFKKPSTLSEDYLKKLRESSGCVKKIG